MCSNRFNSFHSHHPPRMKPNLVLIVKSSYELAHIIIDNLVLHTLKTYCYRTQIQGIFRTNSYVKQLTAESEMSFISFNLFNFKFGKIILIKFKKFQFK